MADGMDIGRWEMGRWKKPEWSVSPREVKLTISQLVSSWILGERVSRTVSQISLLSVIVWDSLAHIHIAINSQSQRKSANGKNVNF